MFSIPKPLPLPSLLALGLLIASAQTAEAALSLRITEGAMDTTVVDNGPGDLIPLTNIIVTTSGTGFPGFTFSGIIFAQAIQGMDFASLQVAPNLTGTVATTVTVEATATDYFGPTSIVNFLAGNASANVLGAGTSVDVQAFADRSNTAFGTGDISTGQILLVGSGSSGQENSTPFLISSAPFSLSVVNNIVLEAGQTTNFSASANLTTPEPASLFLWAGIASTLGVSGLVVSRRRKRGPDGADGDPAVALPETDG